MPSELSVFRLALPAMFSLLSSCTEQTLPSRDLSVEELMDPSTCQKCHSQQYAEWSGSMHAYASVDPLFVALNQRGQDEANVGTFCVGCHAPLAVRTGATRDGKNLASLP